MSSTSYRPARRSCFKAIVEAAWLLPIWTQAFAAPAAGQARLYRDTYGVPHIFADSPAAAYYGAGYAMAEDMGYHASELALQVEGRTAEFFGAAGGNAKSDIEAQQFQFYDTARLGFLDLSPQVRLAFQSFAAGIARRYSEMEEARPDWAIDVTSEHLAATFLAANFYQASFEAQDYELREIGVRLQHPYLGSNAWAIGRDGMVGGETVHFAGPQTPFGDAQSEIHLEWPGGRVAGFGYGLYVDPGLGLTHAWGSTANWPDTSDVYKLRVNEDQQYWDPLAAGGKGAWTALTPSRVLVKIRGQMPASPKYWETRLGPALRLSVDDDGQQWIYVWRNSVWKRMQYVEAVFRKQWAASARAAIPDGAPPEGVSGNWVLADGGGNILYFYNARVFGRRSAGSSHGILPGDDPKSEWLDWAFGLGLPHPLPMALNPKCGFVTSNNEAPWFVAPSGEIPGREAWPAYLVPGEGWGSGETVRGDRAREMIGGAKKLTVEEATRLPFDTAMPKALAWVQAWQEAWKKAPAPPALSPDAMRLHQLLGAWKGTCAADAPGMTAVFYLVKELHPWTGTAEAAAIAPPPDPEDLDLSLYAGALEKAAHKLQRDHGSLLVPWGRIHGIAAEGRWHEMGGGTDLLPAIFQAHAGSVGGEDAVDPDHRIRCSSGSSHLALTIFEGNGEIRRFTVNPGGQHSPKIWPKSPHCHDQTPLFVAGQFKPFWLKEEEVKEHLTPYEGKEGYPWVGERILHISEGVGVKATAVH